MDALCDLDDALSLLSLFSIMPSKSGVEFKVVHNCRRLLGKIFVKIYILSEITVR